MQKQEATASDIDEALALVVELAFQNTTDRYDNPREFTRQSRAIKLVKDTFLRKGGE